MSVGINPPKTAVTKGSSGTATATLPNICKMPGPPAPFVPAPLPNIGKSGDKPDGYTTTVEIESNPVAIKGASFCSMGDAPSKGTGGGMVSANTHGPCKFIGPGSMDVKFEGGNVQLLSDPMTNNGGGSGSPANSGTAMGLLQAAKAKNPVGKDICGAGKHTEEVHYPTVPEEEEDPKKRLAAMKAQATTDGDRFECRAAEHNINDGSITHGRQLSRRTTPQEEQAGAHADDQKIWLVCTVCGYRRESDQSPAPNHNVEAKSTTDALKAAKQKTNNAARVQAGSKVTYKSPVIRNYQQYKSLIDAGFKVIQFA
ncbi:MAG: PAAR-like domain-containing protein [Acidobacteriota bacterium]